MAIETKDKALAPFTKIREIAELYPAGRFHLLLPTTFMEISPLFIPSPVPVVVNPADEREVYVKPGSSKDAEDPEFCFHGQKLQEIANAGGLDFDPSLTRHRHDRKNEPWVCEQIAAGWYIDSLGQRRLISSDWVTHDLTDTSPRTKLITRQGQTALQVARQFICEQCATRARSRAIRKTMNLKSSYRRSELIWIEQVNGKAVIHPQPFVAIRFRLNDQDEDVKKALIARQIGATQEVFGPNGAMPVLDETKPGKGDDLEDLQGEFHEQADAEPEIPDAGGPIAPATPATDVNALIAPILRAAAHQPDQSPASDDLLLTLGTAVRDLFKLNGKATSAARLSVARLIYGPEVKTSRSLSGGQVRALLDLTKEPQGHEVLTALYAHQLEHDATLQAELAKAAA
jgi:hypothetical protein